MIAPGTKCLRGFPTSLPGAFQRSPLQYPLPSVPWARCPWAAGCYAGKDQNPHTAFSTIPTHCHPPTYVQTCNPDPLLLLLSCQDQDFIPAALRVTLFLWGNHFFLQGIGSKDGESCWAVPPARSGCARLMVGNTLTFLPISVPGAAVRLLTTSAFCLQHRHSGDSQGSAACGVQLHPGHLSSSLLPALESPAWRQ